MTRGRNKWKDAIEAYYKLPEEILLKLLRSYAFIMLLFLIDRGNIVEAIEKLNAIKDLEVTYFPLKVAATEALAGLHLELGEDDTSSVIADVCINDLDAIKAELGVGFGSFDTRARALKGLIELAQGNADSSQSCFKDVEGNLGIGNDALSYAEFLHTTRDFSTAKQLYQDGATLVLEGSIEPTR